MLNLIELIRDGNYTNSLSYLLPFEEVSEEFDAEDAAKIYEMGRPLLFGPWPTTGAFPALLLTFGAHSQITHYVTRTDRLLDANWERLVNAADGTQAVKG